MNRSIYRKFGLLAAALLIFSISLLLQYSSFNSVNENGRTRRFEKTFQTRELQLYSWFEDIELKLEGAKQTDYFNILYPYIEKGLEESGFQIFVFEKDTLVYWTGNSVSSTDLLSSGEKDMVFLGNNWSVIKERVVGDKRIVGLIHIKNEFPYENQFLKNDFQKDFKVPRGTEILTEPTEGEYAIHDSWGSSLFQLDFTQVPGYSKFQSQLSLTLYYLGIFLFLGLALAIACPGFIN